MPEKKPIDAVVLKAVANVKVVLDDRSITDPVEALEAAEEQVDLYALLQRGRVESVEYVDYAEEVAGAIVDKQDDPDYDGTEWVEGELVSQSLLPRVSASLERILASAQVPLRELFEVAQTRDLLFGRAARKGIITHPDATPAQRSQAFGELYEDYARIALDFVETSRAAQRHLRREDLMPALQAEDRKIRERALLISTLLGDREIEGPGHSGPDRSR